MNPELSLGIIALATVTTAVLGLVSIGILLYVLGTNKNGGSK